jgi:hypothetical protein
MYLKEEELKDMLLGPGHNKNIVEWKIIEGYFFQL